MDEYVNKMPDGLTSSAAELSKQNYQHIMSGAGQNETPCWMSSYGLYISMVSC